MSVDRCQIQSVQVQGWEITAFQCHSWLQFFPEIALPCKTKGKGANDNMDLTEANPILFSYTWVSITLFTICQSRELNQNIQTNVYFKTFGPGKALGSSWRFILNT